MWYNQWKISELKNGSEKITGNAAQVKEMENEREVRDMWIES